MLDMRARSGLFARACCNHQASRTDPHARRMVNASISYLEGYEGRQNKTGQRMILCARANIGDT